MNDDAISRQAAIDVVSGIDRHFVKYIKELPSVTPKPKTGHWIADEVQLPDRVVLNYHCSVCGRKLIGYSTETLQDAPYCHCGAKMVEPQESEEV